MSKSKSHFEDLAPELLAQVLSSLSDLEPLYCLLQASPAAYRLFTDQSSSKSIVETILSSGNTHTYTIALIRITLLIRSNTLPSSVHNHTTFKDLLRHETSPHRWTLARWTLARWTSLLGRATARTASVLENSSLFRHSPCVRREKSRLGLIRGSRTVEWERRSLGCGVSV